VHRKGSDGAESIRLNSGWPDTLSVRSGGFDLWGLRDQGVRWLGMAGRFGALAGRICLLMKMGHNFWIEVAGEVALSQWRVALLHAVEETGSISSAATRMGVHFRVAWRKIKEMEERLGVRLVLGQTGGPHGGGAELTREARDYIRRFHLFTQGLTETAEKQFREAFGDLG
jgi:molybdate transport system regulatory protein